VIALSKAAYRTPPAKAAQIAHGSRTIAACRAAISSLTGSKPICQTRPKSPDYRWIDPSEKKFCPTACK